MAIFLDKLTVMKITWFFQFSTTPKLLIRKYDNINGILIYNVGKQLFSLVKVNKTAVWHKYFLIIYSVIY